MSAYLTPYYQGSGMTLTYEREWVQRDVADRWLTTFIEDVPWRQDTITIRGKTHPLPRLQQWYADKGRVYRYAGNRMEPLRWTPLLEEIRNAVQNTVVAHFNSVLLNFYRDGNDTVGWHADDEPELGDEPVIASVSIGAMRDFILRHNDEKKKNVARVRIPLAHGSLLVMSDQTQKYWKHSLPRRAGVHMPRVNLTFRNIIV